MKKIIFLLLTILIFTQCNKKVDIEDDNFNELEAILLYEILEHQAQNDYQFDVRMFKLKYGLCFTKFDHKFTQKHNNTNDIIEKTNLMNEANNFKRDMIKISYELINTEPFNIEKAQKTLVLFEDFVNKY